MYVWRQATVWTDLKFDRNTVRCLLCMRLYPETSSVIAGVCGVVVQQWMTAPLRLISTLPFSMPRAPMAKCQSTPFAKWTLVWESIYFNFRHGVQESGTWKMAPVATLITVHPPVLRITCVLAVLNNFEAATAPLPTDTCVPATTPLSSSRSEVEHRRLIFNRALLIRWAIVFITRIICTSHWRRIGLEMTEAGFQVMDWTVSSIRDWLPWSKCLVEQPQPCRFNFWSLMCILGHSHFLIGGTQRGHNCWWVAWTEVAEIDVFHWHDVNVWR